MRIRTKVETVRTNDGRIMLREQYLDGSFEWCFADGGTVALLWDKQTAAIEKLEREYQLAILKYRKSHSKI